jgi:hypothetical protein
MQMQNMLQMQENNLNLCSYNSLNPSPFFMENSNQNDFKPKYRPMINNNEMNLINYENDNDNDNNNNINNNEENNDEESDNKEKKNVKKEKKEEKEKEEKAAQAPYPRALPRKGRQAARGREKDSLSRRGRNCHRVRIHGRRLLHRPLAEPPRIPENSRKLQHLSADLHYSAGRTEGRW